MGSVGTVMIRPTSSIAWVYASEKAFQVSTLSTSKPKEFHSLMRLTKKLIIPAQIFL